jgi:hypothetical protein
MTLTRMTSANSSLPTSAEAVEVEEEIEEEDIGVTEAPGAGTSLQVSSFGLMVVMAASMLVNRK